MCWDDEALYLAYEVLDDHHNPKSDPQESLSEGLAATLLRHLRRRPHEQPETWTTITPYTIAGEDVIRQFVPQWQSCFLKAGIETNIPVVMRHAAGTTVYELKIPRRYLEPMPFEPNQVFGFWHHHQR